MNRELEDGLLSLAALWLSLSCAMHLYPSKLTSSCRAAGLWEPVSTGGGPEYKERQALGAILHYVPLEMVPALAAKDSSKEAWNAIKTMRVRVDRVRRQKLRKNLAFKSREGVEDFSLRLSASVSELQSLCLLQKNQPVWKRHWNRHRGEKQCRRRWTPSVTTTHGR